MRANFHTHTTWCDGADASEAVVLSAVRKGFTAIGFSSHAMLPGDPLEWPLTAAKLPRYAEEIRALKAKYTGVIDVHLGVEADYVKGGVSSPDRAVYASASPEYIIGSVHFVVAPDGAVTCVDKTPERLASDIRNHFGGSAEAFVRAYFEQQREMVRTCDFDVVGHPDLCRKFNGRLRYFDERAPWYMEELAATADAIAQSGKMTEVNTGAISRGWMDDAYPSAEFRAMLRERGVRFMLSADAHAAETIDCAFERFADAEHYVSPVTRG